jgi:glycine cleavage system H protein
LPEVGDKCSKGDTVSNVESAKAVGEVVTPYSGEVVEVNEALDDAPENVSENALGTFIFKVKISDPAEGADLLDEAGYKATL